MADRDTQRLSSASADARRELDEISALVDQLYELEGPALARAAPRLRVLRDGLAGVLDDALGEPGDGEGEGEGAAEGAPEQEQPRSSSELSYLDAEEPAAAEAPHSHPEARPARGPTSESAAAAQHALAELHRLRMERWYAAIQYIKECRELQQQQFAAACRALVEARRRARSAGSPGAGPGPRRALRGR
ncbi:hypothetical protein PsYK624_146570 [Phanerochaete sordida]|uniref:Uncharacterized protein n=1 Tax=Phanerochaete sordida TaxID=48140 RepID=A0A9P3LLL3_9APHY|nr:hypothetical protein PsYK624_146570 [Phanerochaete sordida]